MPVNVAIMIKYSDLLNAGERSPKNYYGQLSRCTGLMPLNVLATINNRLILDKAAHLAWEGEFLSDSIASKVHRFRVETPEDSFVFTRAAMLLNLKLLLGLQPSIAEFKATAVGAIALHGNDYVESEDTSRLASGTLPVIAEFAPMWELQNIRDPRQLLFRSLYLYSLLPGHDAMAKLFASPITEVTLGGLLFHQYFTLLFGMHTNASNAVVATPFPTSILNASEIAQQAHLTEDQFTTFAAAKTMTLEEARSNFAAADAANFMHTVTDNAWTSNQLGFRARPLLKFPDGRFLVLDLQFLFESASAGLSWTLMEHLSDSKRKLFLDYWGEVFEQYVQHLLAHYYPDHASITRLYPPDGQIDGLLLIEDHIVVFEVKAGFIRDDIKGSRDPELIDSAMRRKYVTDISGKGVGVRQLAATSLALLAGKVPDVKVKGRIYPVLVGEDPILQTPGVNIYLHRIFGESIGTKNVAPLTVMLVDELEQLLPHIRAGDLSWQDLVNKRFSGDRMTANPVHTTLIDIAATRGFSRRRETFLASQSDLLVAMIKDAYKDLA